MMADNPRIEVKLEELKQIAAGILVDTTKMVQVPKKDDDGTQVIVKMYLPLLYEELSRIALQGQSTGTVTASDGSEALESYAKVISFNTSNISKDSMSANDLLSTLANIERDNSRNQEEYYKDMLDSTEVFIDNSDEKKRGNLLTRLTGSIKSAIGGTLSNLFAPKPKTVILAKTSIKDIAGVVKAFTPAAQSSFKTQLKDKASTNIVEALSGTITKIGNALTKAIKSISTAINIFIYAIFPLVLLGAVGVLVAGLYFIAKMAIDAIAPALTKIGESIAKGIDTVMDIINNVANALLAISPVGILGSIKSVVEKAFDYMGNLIGNITGVIEKIANSLMTFLNTSTTIKSAVSGVKSFIFGEPNEVEQNTNKFESITNPICESIKSFSDMVKNYFDSLKISSSANVVKTNTIADTRLNRVDYSNTSSSISQGGSNINANYNTNLNNNTSTPTDGAINTEFNKSIISRNKYDYSYSSNPMNNNADSTEIVREIKNTNNLLRELIGKLSMSKFTDTMSLIGD